MQAPVGAFRRQQLLVGALLDDPAVVEHDDPARALIADPRILVLDEATSNVDLHTEGRIEAGLRRLLAGRTAIVIAHRLSTIRQAGRIVVLDHGRIVEQGTHEDLLEAGGPYERLYRDWAEQAAA